MSEWIELPLAVLLKDGAGISYGIVQPGSHQEAGVPVLRVADIRNGRINTQQPLRVAPAIESSYSRTRLRGGELLLTLVGTVGETAVVPDELCGWNVARAVAVVPVRDDIGAYWVRLAMSSAHVQTIIKGRLNTTVQATLNLKDVAQLPVLLPPEPVRNSIARVIADLDDKIELNRRMNNTLEAMARAIFQSWFVDFDPVRAKAGGESPDSICQRLGLTPELLALFPDDFEDVSESLVPVGWVQSSLGEQAKAHGGFIQTGPFGSQLHAADYVDQGIPVVMPQDLVNRRISEAKVARVTEEMAKRLSRHALQPGDVVYSRRGDVERHALVSEREAGWLCGTGCLLVRLGRAWPSQAYLSEALDLPTTREWLVRHAVGATMPNLNATILGNVPLLIPPEPLMAAFERVAGSLRRQQMTNSLESETLAETRDALLPKLLSGELVPEALGQLKA